MLPRTTQQSYSAALGRESQIEPWLAIGQPTACRREEFARNDATVDEPATRSTLRHQVDQDAAEKGLDVRKKPSWEYGEVFFLDIPFYRTRCCGGFGNLKAGPPAPRTLRFPERTSVALRLDLAHDNHQNSNFLFRLR